MRKSTTRNKQTKKTTKLDRHESLNRLTVQTWQVSPKEPMRGRFASTQSGFVPMGVRVLSDLGGGGDFLARKIYAIPECVIVESGIQTHSNCTKNKVHNLPWAGKFFVGVYFAEFGFFRFRGKKSEFGFRTFLVGITFSGIHVQYLKVTKMEAIWSFSLHCLQPISLKFSNVKKEKIFAGFLLGEFVFTGFNYWRSMKNLRNSR